MYFPTPSDKSPLAVGQSTLAEWIQSLPPLVASPLPLLASHSPAPRWRAAQTHTTAPSARLRAQSPALGCLHSSVTVATPGSARSMPGCARSTWRCPEFLGHRPLCRRALLGPLGAAKRHCQMRAGALFLSLVSCACVSVGLCYMLVAGGHGWTHLCWCWANRSLGEGVEVGWTWWSPILICMHILL